MKPAIINGTTERDWLEKVREQMRQGREILVILAPGDQTHTIALGRLCKAHGYRPPTHLPPRDWTHLQAELNLNDYAAKEQGITPDMIFALRPNPSPHRSREPVAPRH